MVHCWVSKPKIDLMSEELVFFDFEVYCVRPSSDLGIRYRYRTREGHPHIAVQTLRAPEVLHRNWKQIGGWIFKVGES